jgi:hypothetical protein
LETEHSIIPALGNWQDSKLQNYAQAPAYDHYAQFKTCFAAYLVSTSRQDRCCLYLRTNDERNEKVRFTYIS